jgi:hypothetical protein
VRQVTDLTRAGPQTSGVALARAFASEHDEDTGERPNRDTPYIASRIAMSRTPLTPLKALPALKPDHLFEMTLEPATGSTTRQVLFKSNTAQAL